MNWLFITFVFYIVFIFGIEGCPDGTIESFSNKTLCYLYNSTKQAFLSAEETCKQKGGHLASVQSMLDNVYMSNEALDKFDMGSDYWIGATRLLLPGVWDWTDKSYFNFADWDKGQPVDGHDCAAATLPSGIWISDFCYKEKSFVCLIESTTPPEPSKCSEDWSYYSNTGFCYRAYTKDSTWGDAEAYCFTQGGHLTSIHSLDENNFVSNLIPFSPNDHICDTGNFAWIGIFTVTLQANWMWTDNSPFNFSAWASGHPISPSNSFCGIIWNGPPCGAPLETWADYIGNRIAQYFVCKKLSL